MQNGCAERLPMGGHQLLNVILITAKGTARTGPQLY